MAWNSLKVSFEIKTRIESFTSTAFEGSLLASSTIRPGLD